MKEMFKICVAAVLMWFVVDCLVEGLIINMTKLLQLIF